MEEQQEKRNSIMEAAKDCFLNYGFKRTSMADIAEKVGISRPALYLYFDNKESIFRALSTQLHEESLAQAQIALRQKGDLGDRLLQAFEYRMVDLFALVHNSAHGEELIDINGKIATDIFLTTRHKFVVMLAQALQEAETDAEIQLSRIELDATEAAELLVYSAYGQKQAAQTVEYYRLSLQRLTKIFVKAVIESNG